MSKIGYYLQEHLTGEVMDSVDARRYFANDASLFTQTPSLVIYPRNENDVRKTARFLWQLAERGKVVPITARGSGTDLTGAAVGGGVMMVFPSHMNKILEIDLKSGRVAVEPGINFSKLQQTLQTHGLFIPAYPTSYEYSTVGGAVANNASGEKSVKYGSIINYIKGLRVVLANGEVIETGRIGKKELTAKLGLTSLEGDLYRAVDAAVEGNQELLGTIMTPPVSKDATGYNLHLVKDKDGSFDLTPLFVGSQGTLGCISEIVLQAEPYHPNTSLIVAKFTDMTLCVRALQDIRELTELPSALEAIDSKLISFVKQKNPHQLPEFFQGDILEIVVFIEYDTTSDRQLKKLLKKAVKAIEKQGGQYIVEQDREKQEELWVARHASMLVLGHAEGNKKALPFIEDAIVPLAAIPDYCLQMDEVFSRYGLTVAKWGSIGDGNLHMQPYLDISELGDRQKIFKLIDEQLRIVSAVGGRLSAQHNDGRLRGIKLKDQVGEEVYALFESVKRAADPHGLLNPGVKIGVKEEHIVPLLRNEYSLSHLYNFMPRS